MHLSIQISKFYISTDIWNSKRKKNPEWNSTHIILILYICMNTTSTLKPVQFGGQGEGETFHICNLNYYSIKSWISHDRSCLLYTSVKLGTGHWNTSHCRSRPTSVLNSLVVITISDLLSVFYFDMSGCWYSNQSTAPYLKLQVLWQASPLI
jgi:hypothetical protein